MCGHEENIDIVSLQNVSLNLKNKELRARIEELEAERAELEALEDYAAFVESDGEWNQLSVWLPLCDAQNYLRSVGEHFPFACIFKRIREEG